ncbi:unnamed protein product, partial [Prorocentrum cordatum]
ARPWAMPWRPSSSTSRTATSRTRWRRATGASPKPRRRLPQKSLFERQACLPGQFRRARGDTLRTPMS